MTFTYCQVAVSMEEYLKMWLFSKNKKPLPNSGWVLVSEGWDTKYQLQAVATPIGYSLGYNETVHGDCIHNSQTHSVYTDSTTAQ